MGPRVSDGDMEGSRDRCVASIRSPDIGPFLYFREKMVSKGMAQLDVLGFRSVLLLV